MGPFGNDLAAIIGGTGSVMNQNSSAATGGNGVNNSGISNSGPKWWQTAINSIVDGVAHPKVETKVNLDKYVPIALFVGVCLVIASIFKSN